MSELLGAPGALGAFALSLLIFGFAPGMVLAAIVRLIPDLDRRRELQAELYEVPRWERPYWVMQQFEVALRIGLAPQIEWYWGRHVWHRCKIESGLAQTLKWSRSPGLVTRGASSFAVVSRVVRVWSVWSPLVRRWLRRGLRAPSGTRPGACVRPGTRPGWRGTW